MPTGLSFYSTFHNKEIVSDCNSQTMIEWWVYKLGCQVEAEGAIVKELDDLTIVLNKEKQAGALSATSLNRVQAILEGIAYWSFSCNGILEEAWERSVTKTKSDKTYANVGKRFADHFVEVLNELSASSPSHKADIQMIGTAYVNKHHLMLKSLHPVMQILHENLLHAGLGSADKGNSELHKAIHKLTALNGKLDYTKMDADIAAIIKSVVTLFSQNKGHNVFMVE